MERKLTAEDISQLKVGQAFVIKNVILGEELCVLCSIIEGFKYPTIRNNRPCYTENNKVIYADENGETGDERMSDFALLSASGDYMFNERTILTTEFDIYLIDEKHEKYDAKFAKEVMIFSEGFDKLKNFPLGLDD